MLNKVRAIIESGIFSFLFFWSFVLLYKALLPPEAWVAVVLISIAHYLTAIFCGYWAGWRSKTDGWMFGIVAYFLFKGLTTLFGVHAVLPFPLHIKLLGYIPILALLMFGGVIGEQRAHYAPVSQRDRAIYPAVKRIVDMLVSTVSLLLLAPIMLAIAFGIKVGSPGPIFFHQKRLGQHGRIINVIKFRTMSPDADEIVDRLQLLNEQEDEACQIKDDPRVFPFGKFLRTTSLDELPQLINIAKGEMSMVGPRPLVPEELETSDAMTLKRLDVKPGLTGLAQINGRGNLTFTERLMKDIEYVENQSLVLDAKIFLATIRQVLLRHGAY
ncbi:MAG TPA: sugar transferase [Candidatus Aquicultor sp.]|jgi:lipopolysaccharide/colanic/teichoic acid biosynthesis glycosyltransferase